MAQKDARLKGYKVDPDGTPTGPKLQWTVEIEVDPLWITDGFNLADSVEEDSEYMTAENVHNQLRELMLFTQENEVAIRITQSPDAALIRALQGEPEPEVLEALKTIESVRALVEPERFWITELDPESVPEHAAAVGTFGADTVGVVDEEAGGIIAYVHRSKAETLRQNLAGS